MKKIILLFVISIIGLNKSQAQDFKYEDIVDEPDRISFVQGGIGIWDMNLNGFNMQLWNLNPRLYVQVNKLFSLEIEGSKSLLDRFYPADDETDFSNDFSSFIYLKSQYKSTAATNFNIIGTWYFNSKVKEEDVTHSLSQKGNVTYVATLPTNIMYSKGLRLGYSKGSTFYSLNQTLSNNLERTDIANQIDNVSINDGNATTTIDYANFRIGYSSTEVVNKIIKTDKYGEKDFRNSTTYYGDLFIPIKYDADDMYYNNFNGSSNSNFQLELYPVTINNKKKLPVGGCVGIKTENVSGHGIGIGVEAGMLPGFVDDILGTAYIRINISYQFAYLFE